MNKSLPHDFIYASKYAQKTNSKKMLTFFSLRDQFKTIFGRPAHSVSCKINSEIS